MADTMHENVIEWIDGETIAHVTYSSRYAGRIKRLAEKNPDDVKIIVANKDGSVLAHVPLKWVNIRKPRQMNITDERREELRKQLESMRTASGIEQNEANFDFYDEGGEILD